MGLQRFQESDVADGYSVINAAMWSVKERDHDSRSAASKLARR